VYKDIRLFGKKYRLRKLALACYYGACALYGLSILGGLWMLAYLLYAISW